MKRRNSQAELVQGATEKGRLFFRATDQYGYACNGGCRSFRADPCSSGSPGRWAPRIPVEKIRMCMCGYHCTEDPSKWSGSRICLVEVRDIVESHADKIVCSSFRELMVVDPDKCVDTRVYVACRRPYLQRENLAMASLSDVHLAGADLSRACLAGASLDWANLSGAMLVQADLEGANLAGVNLVGANLFGANLAGANLASGLLSGAILDRANLTGARFDAATMAGASLSMARMAGANLSGARLDGADLSGVDLRSVVLGGALLREARLGGAILP